MSSDSKIKKTKQIFLDAARQVFANLGVGGATMNDIAEASKKGRRTLYTYFKSKEEVYYALVEQEMFMILEKLESVRKREDLAPQDKLLEFIFTHLDCMRDLVERNGSLKADFFSDIKTIEFLRRPIDQKELRMVKSILSEGQKQGVFDIADLNVASNILLYALKGLEVPYTRQKLAQSMNEHRSDIGFFLVNGFSSQKARSVSKPSASHKPKAKKKEGSVENPSL